MAVAADNILSTLEDERTLPNPSDTEWVQWKLA